MWVCHAYLPEAKMGEHNYRFITIGSTDYSLGYVVNVLWFFIITGVLK